MESTTSKCVMVLDENLPLGLLANTAAILGITLGKHMPEAVGADVLDVPASHLGIIRFPCRFYGAMRNRSEPSERHCMGSIIRM